MVAPVTVHKATEAHGHGAEVALEAVVVAARGGVFVDDDFRPVVLQPVVDLPGRFLVPGADERRHLRLHAHGIGADPLGETDHARLVEQVMVEAGPDVDAHRPDFLVLRVAVFVDLRLRITVRRTAATGPVDTGHVEVDVIRHRHVRVLLGDVEIRPVVAAALAAFLTGPEAEHHRPARRCVGHRFGHFEDHGGPSGVVVSAHAGAVGAHTGHVRVEGEGVDRWCDVKVRAEDHPFVREHGAEAEAADVVALRVLVALPIGVLVALNVDLKAERFHFLNQVLRGVFVGSIALTGPAVEETFRAVGQVSWIDVLV